MSSKQYLATQKGGPFQLSDATIPVPQDNEIVIATKAFALNPIDWKKLYSGIMVQSWPAKLGNDCAGIVHAVGDKVKRFKVGDEVMAFSTTGCFESHTVVPEVAAAHKPSGWSFEEAASVPCCYASAVQAIYGVLGIPYTGLTDGRADGFTPQSILVTGGSSAFGAAALQLLRHFLPNATILTTSSAKHWEHNKRNGASASFDQNSNTLIDDIRAATPGQKGVDAILDTVNGVASNEALFKTYNPAGSKKMAEVVTSQNLKEVPQGIDHQIVLGAMVFKSPGGANVMSALEGLVAQGKYKLPIQVKTVGTGYEAIATGLEELKAGVSGTKLAVAV